MPGRRVSGWSLLSLKMNPEKEHKGYVGLCFLNVVSLTVAAKYFPEVIKVMNH